MKVCHVSFGKINTEDVGLWLDSISYHTKVLEATATLHDVVSFHYWDRSQKILKNGVVYEFLKCDLIEKCFLTKLVAEVKRETPGVIVLHGMHSCLNVLQFVRNFTTLQIYVQHHGEKPFAWPKSFIQSINDRYVLGYFFSSAEMGNEWVQKRQINGHKKIFEVLEATSSFEPELRSDLKKSSLKFLWVGRINANKDPETLIDGFIGFLAKYPEARLKIISREIHLLEQKLIDKISTVEDAIELTGSVDPSQMQELMKEASFIISTSLYEGSGIAVLEAMSFGCIPVLTNIPSFKTITSNGKVGVLFQANSSTGLTNALRKAAEMKISDEHLKVLDHFRNTLSARSIANRINEVISRSEKVR